MVLEVLENRTSETCGAGQMMKKELIFKMPLREDLVVELWLWYDVEEGYDLMQVLSRAQDYLGVMQKHLAEDGVLLVKDV